MTIQNVPMGLVQRNKEIIKNYFPYIIISLILIQTLFYKFSGHQESVVLFTKIKLLGLPEFYGRLGTGIIELLVSIGIFIKPVRKVSLFGIIILMIGALYFHIKIIGFEGNNFALFISGMIALLLSIYLLLRK